MGRCLCVRLGASERVLVCVDVDACIGVACVCVCRTSIINWEFR